MNGCRIKEKAAKYNGGFFLWEHGEGSLASKEAGEPSPCFSFFSGTEMLQNNIIYYSLFIILLFSFFRLCSCYNGEVGKIVK